MTNKNSDRICREDIAEMNVLFVHSDIDDFGLTSNQFRVYAHILRRAGKADRAWPGIDSMSQICRMHKETVIECVRFLEMHNLLRAERRTGQSTIYYVTRRSEWIRPNRSEIGNGADRSESGNGAVGIGERHRSESGNVRKSTEGSPVSKSNGAHAPGVVDIRARKRKTKKIGRITDPLGLRLGSIFGRSPDTAWSDKEIVALEDVHSLAITEVRIRAVECYYASERRKEKNCCRRDLVTLLNNLNTEADRAILWCQQNRQSCDNMKRRLWPNEYKSTGEAKKLPPAQPAASDEERARFLKASRAWRAAGMPADRPIESFLEG